MRVSAKDKRGADPGVAAAEAVGLNDRQNVGFIEAPAKPEPRYPDVPKVTRSEVTAVSGISAK
jgi:hypothetical protein